MNWHSDLPGRGWWYGGGGGMMLYEAVVWVDADPSGVPTDPTTGGLVVDRQVWQRGPGREITWVGPFQGIHSHLVTYAPWSAHIWNLSLTRSGCTRRSCASGISESTMPVKNQICCHTQSSLVFFCVKQGNHILLQKAGITRILVGQIYQQIFGAWEKLRLGGNLSEN